MSKKFGNPCATYNIPLNNDDNDVFRTGCVHLYHFLHCKSVEYKPLMLKMHLEFVNSPVMTEAEGKNVEQQLEEEIKALKDALRQSKNDGNQLMDRIAKLEKNNSLDYSSLSSSDNAPRQSVQQLETKIKTLEDNLLVMDRLKDDVNKLMDCVVKLENPLSINVLDKSTDIVNNTCQDKQSYDENNLNSDDSSLTGEAGEENIERNNSNNGMLQSVQQLEARIKTLEDALLQAKSDGNKLTEGVETADNKVADNATDGVNNVTEDPKASKKTNNESDLSTEQNNATEKVASASEDHHTCTVSEEKQEVLDLRWNCVLIQNPKCNTANLDEAFSYVRELAKEMNARIADNSVIHIDMDSRNWYVYFRDAESKFKFLRNRFIYEYNPNIACLLRILDYTDCGIVDIENFQSSDLSLETAVVNVLGLAKKMGIKSNRNFIDHIDVYSTEPNFLTYSVRFNSENMKKAYLQKQKFFKKFPETQSLKMTDRGGHTLSCDNINNFSMALASANIIGFAEVMDLSLSTDNFKRVYVLNTEAVDHSNNINFSLVVEFSSKDVKNKFLKRKSELNEIENTWISNINISDIKTEGGNIVSIKYDDDSNDMFTVISFIGLAKQLGVSFTPDQTDRFIELSQFISNASS